MSFDVFKYIPQIDFVAKRKITYFISAILLTIGIVAFFVSGIKYGVDFAGGVAVQLKFVEPVSTIELSNEFEKLNVSGLFVQEFGGANDYLVRFTSESGTNDALRNDINDIISAKWPNNEFIIQKLDYVGPKVGKELRDSALEAMFFAVLLISVYISGRFEQRWGVAAAMAAILGSAMYLATWLQLGIAINVLLAMVITLVACYKLKLNYALGAVIALLHDVLITVGLLIIFGYEIDLNIVAAILTLIGYSLNDTIIVYDRIRENIQVVRKQKGITIEALINMSINQTLSRTVMTGSTTLAACLSLFFLGGSAIHGFAFTILIGIFIGTFSSIFVASPVLMAFGNIEQYTYVPEKVNYEKPGEHGVV